MLFALIAKDGVDKDSLQRRLAAREAHIAVGDEAVKRGEQILGAALLNKDDEMCGSLMIVDFENREAVEGWLKNEPYVIGDVWKQIEIYPCRIGPSFQHILNSASPNLRVKEG